MSALWILNFQRGKASRQACVPFLVFYVPELGRKLYVGVSSIHILTRAATHHVADDCWEMTILDH